MVIHHGHQPWRRPLEEIIRPTSSPEIRLGQTTSNWTSSVTVRPILSGLDGRLRRDSNRRPRTQFGVLEPPDQPVIHLPICHPCSIHQWDDTWMPSSGDLQSPTMPPANHFDRPRQSTSPGGREPRTRRQQHQLDRDASCTPDGVQNEAPKTNQIQSFHNSPPPI